MLSTQDTLSQQKKPFILLRPFVAFWHWMFPPTLADLDRQSKTARIVATVLIIAFFLTLIIITLLHARGWHSQFKTWRSDRLVEKSRNYEDQENHIEALRNANEAFMLDPDNPNAIRSIARYATMMKRNEARFLWNKLRETGSMTDEDTVWEIRALASLKEDKAAADNIEKLLRNTNPTRKIVEVADQVLPNMGRKQQLIAILKDYLEKTPDDLETRTILAIRQLQFGTESDKAEGLQSLWTLAEDPSKEGLKAIEFLDSLQLAGTADVERLIDLLEKHPLAKEEHRIAALRRLANLHPERKRDIIEKAMKDRLGAKREHLVPLARWISAEAQSDATYAEQLVTFLREDMVIDYIALLENYLNALTILKRHDAIERIVKDPRTRLTLAQKSFYLVHLAYVTDMGWDEVNSRLVDALAAAQGEARPDMIMKIAQYAEQRNHPTVAEQAYRAGTTIIRIEREAFDGLLRLTYRNGNSKGFMEAASETARRWPDNQFFLERFIYASLLSGIEMEAAIDQAKKLLGTRPQDSQRKLIMALAYARQMDPKTALGHLEHINLNELTLGQGAVLCGIMQAAGASYQAMTIARQIPADSPMLPEEQRFLDSARLLPDGG